MRVRLNNDAGLSSPGLNTDPHCGEFYFDSSSAYALTTPTAATAITSTNATGLTAGEQFGGLGLASAGSFTITRPGIYRLFANLSEVTPVDSQVITLEFFKNGAAIGKPIKAKYTQASTSIAIPSIVCEGLANLVGGDVITLTVIASTGNFGSKRLHFGLVQLTDVAVSPVA